MRKNLADLVKSMIDMGGIQDLALTTNGGLLSKHAKNLHDAGLQRLNVHLDTLDNERFRTITRRDDLQRVMRGLGAALEAEFESIKINAVAIEGSTEEDVIPLVRFGRAHGIELRFIEFMPLDAQRIWSLDRVLTVDNIIGL